MTDPGPVRGRREGARFGAALRTWCRTWSSGMPIRPAAMPPAAPDQPQGLALRQRSALVVAPHNAPAVNRRL